MPISEAEKGQISRGAADVYQRLFVPALFQQWTDIVADAAGIRAKQRVLDVACGTGVLTAELQRRAGSRGEVVGLDCNEGMLAVARRELPDVEWCHATAESIPFPDNEFDAVTCQFGVMFFSDARQGLAEMVRVLRPQRRLAIAVWNELSTSPGYHALANLLRRLFGRQAADTLRAPFALGDVTMLQSLLTDTGLQNIQLETHTGSARFPSIQTWITTEIKGWVLADMLDDAQFRRLQAEAEDSLLTFASADGRVEFPIAAHIAVGVKE